MSDPANWRPSRYIDGPNECGYFTAGIDVPNIFDRPNWHYHAIEIHSKNRADAEMIRNMILARTQ